LNENNSVINNDDNQCECNNNQNEDNENESAMVKCMKNAHTTKDQLSCRRTGNLPPPKIIKYSDIY